MPDKSRWGFAALFGTQEDKTVADREVYYGAKGNGEEIGGDVVESEAINQQSHENQIARDGDSAGPEVESQEPAGGVAIMAAATVYPRPSFVPYEIVQDGALHRERRSKHIVQTEQTSKQG